MGRIYQYTHVASCSCHCGRMTFSQLFISSDLVTQNVPRYFRMKIHPSSAKQLGILRREIIVFLPEGGNVRADADVDTKVRQFPRTDGRHFLQGVFAVRVRQKQFSGKNSGDVRVTAERTDYTSFLLTLSEGGRRGTNKNHVDIV